MCLINYCYSTFFDSQTQEAANMIKQTVPSRRRFRLEYLNAIQSPAQQLDNVTSLARDLCFQRREQAREKRGIAADRSRIITVDNQGRFHDFPLDALGMQTVMQNWYAKLSRIINCATSATFIYYLAQASNQNKKA